MMVLGLTDWLLAVSAVILLIYVYGTWNHNYFTKLGIPYRKPYPLIGNMAPALFRVNNIANHLLNIYNEFNEAKMVGVFEFTMPVIMLRDPEIIKQITVKGFEYFTDHRIAVTEDSDPLFGKNLFALKGDRWKNMRHTLSPAFTSSKMKSMFLLIEKCGNQMADHLDEKCKGEANGILSLNIKEFYTRFTNDVIATSAFGIHCDSLKNPDNEFYRMGKAVTDFTGFKFVIFFLFDIFPKLMQFSGITIFSAEASKFFRSLVHGTIATREKKGIVRPDMIHLLMQARKGKLKGDANEDAVPDRKKKTIALTDDDITANALLFFLAGFDTSATVLSFMTLLLTINPDAQRRVQEEVDEILSDDDGKLTYEGVQRMKYLDMVMSETLRLYPPAPTLDRKCVRPYVIAATDTTPRIKMNVGDGIWIPSYSLHRDPEYFPEPDLFDPERFSDENKHSINPFVYLPFGVGPRNCIGLRFAQMEAKIAVASILSRFTFEVVEKTPTTIHLTAHSFPMAPIGGFWVGIKPRTDTN